MLVFSFVSTIPSETEKEDEEEVEEEKKIKVHRKPLDLNSVYQRLSLLLWMIKSLSASGVWEKKEKKA